MDNVPEHTPVSKFDRIDAVKDDPRLLRHRFLLSENPALRKKLHALQEAITVLKENHPGLITLQLLGSHTKGYADEDSDLDLQAVFSEEKLEESDGKPEEAAEMIRGYLAQKLKMHVSKVNIQYHTIESGDREDMPRYELFLLSLGDAIRPYREAAIAFYENREDGEERWKDTMRLLWERENLYFSPELMKARLPLYPDLAHARGYFLPKAKDPTNVS